MRKPYGPGGSATFANEKTPEKPGVSVIVPNFDLASRFDL
jgi:hypothetical protein